MTYCDYYRPPVRTTVLVGVGGFIAGEEVELYYGPPLDSDRRLAASYAVRDARRAGGRSGTVRGVDLALFVIPRLVVSV